FFSSRRRHTRSKRDWSSDVCSSDLVSVGTDVRIAEGVSVGRDSYVNGRCQLDEGVSVGKGANLSNRVAVGEGSALGDGASVGPRSEERRVGKAGRSRGGGWPGGEAG